MAAWSAYEAPAAPGDLCCGFAGRAYALLTLHRQTDERHWLARARAIADPAATSVRADSLRRNSLYKGDVGVALLAADLQAPEYACMPYSRPGLVALAGQCGSPTRVTALAVLRQPRRAAGAPTHDRRPR